MSDIVESHESDRISEGLIPEILNQLEEDRTVLTLNLIGKDYERLTIVIGQKKINQIPHFLIDYPHEFKQKIGDGKEERISFEFVGRDKVQYAFRTTVAGSIPGGILIKFPEYILRLQRRRYFRVAPPMGTKFVYNRNMKKTAVDVINVSEGGVLLNQEKRPDPVTALNQGEDLTDLYLICPEKGFKLKVHIKRGMVRRVEHDAETGRTRYALQFLGIEQKEKNKLNTFIYHYQREILRRRYLLERG